MRRYQSNDECSAISRRAVIVRRGYLNCVANAVTDLPFRHHGELNLTASSLPTTISDQFRGSGRNRTPILLSATGVSGRASTRSKSPKTGGEPPLAGAPSASTGMLKHDGERPIFPTRRHDRWATPLRVTAINTAAIRQFLRTEHDGRAVGIARRGVEH